MPPLMTKTEAVEIFGGIQQLADGIGVNRSRISQWPSHGELPQRDADRVMGAALRLGFVKRGRQSAAKKLIVIS